MKAEVPTILCCNSKGLGCKIKRQTRYTGAQLKLEAKEMLGREEVHVGSFDQTKER